MTLTGETAIRAASEAVFGSTARGDIDRLSDRDFLIVDDDPKILQARAKTLKAEGVSVAAYTFRKLESLAARRALFVQHLRLEASIVADRDGRLAAVLGKFRPKENYNTEIRNNAKLADLIATVPPGAKAELWAADVLYVTVRNFGVLWLAGRQRYLFAYDRILEALQDEGVVNAVGVSNLRRLRFLKSLYRGDNSTGLGIVLRKVEAALAGLPMNCSRTIHSPFRPMKCWLPPPRRTAHLHTCMSAIWKSGCLPLDRFAVIRSTTRRLLHSTNGFAIPAHTPISALPVLRSYERSSQRSKSVLATPAWADPGQSREMLDITKSKASSRPPQKAHFPIPPKPAILPAQTHPACSFVSSIHPLPPAAPTSAVLLRLGLGPYKWQRCHQHDFHQLAVRATAPAPRTTRTLQRSIFPARGAPTLRQPHISQGTPHGGYPHFFDHQA